MVRVVLVGGAGRKLPRYRQGTDISYLRMLQNWVVK